MLGDVILVNTVNDIRKALLCQNDCRGARSTTGAAIQNQLGVFRDMREPLRIAHELRWREINSAGYMSGGVLERFTDVNNNSIFHTIHIVAPGR